MRLLFEMDSRDYDPKGKALVRDSARCIAIKNGRVAMVHSLKFDYYKFPGGGIEAGESSVSALIRETREETGLKVIPDSVKEFGCAKRIQKSSLGHIEYLIQENFYYLCRVKEEVSAQNLDDYEKEAEFTPEWVEPQRAIEANRKDFGHSFTQSMVEREARVLEILLEEGYFNAE